MKLSWNWLNNYIDLNNYTPYEIASILTMKTCEAEGISPFLACLSNIYVCKILKIEQHPNADKLKICSVFDGEDNLVIVTGASNVTVNKKYPLARIGSILSDGTKIEASKLRNVDSYGMLCSAEEIGLESFIFPNIISEGLLELPDTFEVGKNMAESLQVSPDFIIEIDNKSITHRPDLWSHFGFARELSAILNVSLKYNPIHSVQEKITSTKQTSKESGIRISILDNTTIAYSYAIISNVVQTISPLNIQALLLAVGMRPINNIVDASNYVMLELGLPNHAFDKNLIGQNIEISLSQNGERIITLDDKNRELPQGITLIRSENKPVAIAGVIGGKETEITPSSNVIFLESACFHRKYIRKAVSKLGIRTEASQRFEKGQDPSLTEPTVIRFLEVLSLTSPTVTIESFVTQFTEPLKNNMIHTSFELLQSLLGNINLSQDIIINTLQSLGMKCEKENNLLKVIVPSYRSYFDIQIPQDLTEELGRMLGYKNIQPTPFLTLCRVPLLKNEIRDLEHKLRNLLVNSYHFTEVYNYCFHSEKDVTSDKRYESKPVELLNSIQNDLKFMRVSPLLGILKNISDNQTQKKEIRIFEIEKIFLRQMNVETLPKQKQSLCIEKNFIAAAIVSEQSSEDVLLSISSILGDILNSIGLPRHLHLRSVLKEAIFHPGRSGIIHDTKHTFFKWGEIHPKLCNDYSIDKKVYYFEAFLEDLVSIDSNISYYKPVVKYPSSDFECTLIADFTFPFKNIETIVYNHVKQFPNIICEDVEYISTYTGSSIDTNKKAISIRVTWRNPNNTMEHNEIKQLQTSLLKTLDEQGLPIR